MIYPERVYERQLRRDRARVRAFEESESAQQALAALADAGRRPEEAWKVLHPFTWALLQLASTVLAAETLGIARWLERVTDLALRLGRGDEARVWIERFFVLAERAALGASPAELASLRAVLERCPSPREPKEADGIREPRNGAESPGVRSAALAIIALGLEQVPPGKTVKAVERIRALFDEELFGLLLSGADEWLARGFHDRARNLCTAADVGWRMSGRPVTATALRLADRWTRLAEPDLAEQVYRALLEQVPDEPSLHLLLGWLLLMHRPVDALQPLRKTLEAEDPELRALGASGLLLLALDALDLDSVIALIDTAAGSEGSHAAVLAFTEALASAGPTIDAAGRARLYAALGSGFLGSRWAQQAVCCLERARGLDDCQARVWLDLAGAYFMQGRTLEAAEAYERMLALRPEDAAVERYLGHTKLRMGLLDEALRHSERALALRPDYAAATQQVHEYRKLMAAGGLGLEPREWPL